MSEFFDESKIIGSMGDFWYELYTGKEQLSAVVKSFLEVQKQIEQETLELEQSIDRHTIPVFRKLHWLPVKLLESEFVNSRRPYITFDSGLNYNEGYSFGHRVNKSYKVNVPEEVVSIGTVQECIFDNRVSITNLVIKNGSFYMDWNPFNTSTTYVREIYNENGEITDREATIWLKDIQIDKEDLYNLFGYVLGIKLNSSEQYKALINGLMDSLINGPSEKILLSVLQAVTGITSSEHLKIYSPSDTIIDIDGIHITRNLIPGNVGETFVENKPCTITVSQQDSFTKVLFPCSGNSTEINNVLFSKGKDNCVKITDACEITTINKLLNKSNTQEASTAEESVSQGGLSTWVRIHRFQ